MMFAKPMIIDITKEIYNPAGDRNLINRKAMMPKINAAMPLIIGANPRAIPTPAASPVRIKGGKDSQ